LAGFGVGLGGLSPGSLAMLVVSLRYQLLLGPFETSGGVWYQRFPGTPFNAVAMNDSVIITSRGVGIGIPRSLKIRYVVDGQPSHYNAAVQVFPDGDGSRVVWTIDLLPNELAPTIGGMMDHAAGFMKRTLEAT
jgi:hypothetical protein